MIDVRISRGPTLGGGMFAALVICALFLAYWKAVLSIVAVCAIAALIFMGWRAWQRTVDQQVRHNARLAADAATQHNWVMRGDPRGTYGADCHDVILEGYNRGKEPGC